MCRCRPVSSLPFFAPDCAVLQLVRLCMNGIETDYRGTFHLVCVAYFAYNLFPFSYTSIILSRLLQYGTRYVRRRRKKCSIVYTVVYTVEPSVFVVLKNVLTKNILVKKFPAHFHIPNYNPLLMCIRNTNTSIASYICHSARCRIMKHATADNKNARATSASASD